MNTVLSSSVVSDRTAAATQPWWMVLGALGVCVLVMGATWVQASSPAVPTASTRSPTAMALAAAQAAPAVATRARGPDRGNEADMHAVCRGGGRDADHARGPGLGRWYRGGGVLGGVVGHQVGKGSGRAVATVLGAMGGGWAGHAIEKKMTKTTAYRVQLRMQDGSNRTVEQSHAPLVGSRVIVEGNVLKAA